MRLATTSRTHIFKGQHERIGHHKSRGAFRSLSPYLWVNHFQGLDFTYKEKTTLPEARDDVCEIVSVASFGVTPKRVTTCSASKFGIINPISFRQRSGGINQRFKPTSPLNREEVLHTPVFTRFRAWLRAD